MVSVSGSSGTLRYFGTARKFAPADVGPVLFALELNGGSELLTSVARLLDGFSEARDGEDPAPRRNQLARGIALGAGVKDQHVFGHGRNLDEVARPRLLGIAAGGEHRRQRRVLPGQRGVGAEGFAPRNVAQPVRYRQARLERGK